MHLWRHLSIVVLFAAHAVQAAVVYKWTDADGVVHYADQPVPGAEKITTGISTVHTVTTQYSPKKAVETPKSQPKLGYTTVAIAAPTPEQTFFDAPVAVRLNVEPELMASHTLVWRLNGATLDDKQDSVSFVLENLPRGVYSLSATITDPATQESTTSEPVTFYVHQHSILAPKPK